MITFMKKIPTIEYMTLLNVWRDSFAGHPQTPLEHIRDHLDDCSSLALIDLMAVFIYHYVLIYLINQLLQERALQHHLVCR